MKTIADILNNVIYEKLKVDDITFDKFPINGTLNDIIEFLKDNDFKYVHCGGGIDEWFNNYKSKCFYKTEEHLWFGDTSKEKISKDNPIFMYRILYNSFGVYYCNKNGIMRWLVGENTVNTEKQREKFLEELNKRFGWQ